MPLFWFLVVFSIIFYLQLYQHRRLTLLVASIYLMFYMLLVFSEKYKSLKKYQTPLIFFGSYSIIFGAMTGGYYLFKGNYAEIFSLPELIGLVKLWGG